MRGLEKKATPEMGADGVITTGFRICCWQDKQGRCKSSSLACIAVSLDNSAHTRRATLAISSYVSPAGSEPTIEHLPATCRVEGCPQLGSDPTPFDE